MHIKHVKLARAETLLSTEQNSEWLSRHITATTALCSEIHYFQWLAPCLSSFSLPRAKHCAPLCSTRLNQVRLCPQRVHCELHCICHETMCHFISADWEIQSYVQILSSHINVTPQSSLVGNIRPV